MQRAGRLGALVIAAGALSACFDSGWLQQQRAQQAAVNNARPAELQATGTEADLGAPSSQRALRVRAYASPRYAAEVLDWPARLADSFAAANEVLAPTIAARLDLAESKAWPTPDGDDDLVGCLARLEKLDDAAGVDLVIGLVGSVPRAEASFHELGRANVPGKHLVLRAMNDAREMEALATFERVDEKTRRDVYHARKRHKTTAVLLHELGHALGAPHEKDDKSVLRPAYDPKTTGFGDAAVALMRLSIARLREPDAASPAAFAATFAAQIEKTSDAWVPADRDELLARLHARATPAPVASTSSSGRKRPTSFGKPDAPGAPPPADPLAAMNLVDRHTFEKALVEKRDGHASEARALATPLFAAYPDVAPVQDLRCQLAMEAGGAWDKVQAECARSLALAGGAPKP